MKLDFNNSQIVALSFFASVCVVIVLAWAVLTSLGPPRLDTQIVEARAMLEQVRTQGRLDALPYSITIPTDNDTTTDERKVLFMAKMLPLILVENSRISAQREKVLSGTLDSAQLNALGLAYGLIPQDVTHDELMLRIDVLPTSLVLAQAAIESAWGTSRFAQQGHAYFGERTYDPDAPGIAPKRASGFKVRSFNSAQMSVRSYMRTLNTHRAYALLRSQRAQLRSTGQPVSGLALANYLKNYSEIGGNYIQLIRRTIEDNQLQQFDQAFLASH